MTFHKHTHVKTLWNPGRMRGPGSCYKAGKEFKDKTQTKASGRKDWGTEQKCIPHRQVQEGSKGELLPSPGAQGDTFIRFFFFSWRRRAPSSNTMFNEHLKSPPTSGYFTVIMKQTLSVQGKEVLESDCLVIDNKACFLLGDSGDFFNVCLIQPA